MKLRRKCCCNIGSENVLLIATVTAVVLGIVVGVGIQASGVPLTPKQVVLLKFPGEIFIRALKMIILPLITSSLITSLATLDSGSAGKIGIRAFLFYFCTTLLAVTVGLILVVAIQPGFRGGKSNTEDGAKKSEKKLEECFGGGAGDTILDLIRNIFPVNIVKAMISAQQTCYRFEEEVGNETRKLPIKEALTRLKSNDTSAKLISQIPRTRITTSMNILGMVVFSIIFGIVLGKYQSKCQALIDVFAALEFAIMKIVMVIIWFSPIGILFLIAGQIVAVTDPVAEMKRLAWYILTVLIGLGIHGCITLLVILALLGRRNPFRFIAGLSQALLTALGTSSSSATMPLTMKCLEENLDVDSRVVRFMIPLGATVNMDGTALYEAVACIYISQYAGMHLNVGEVILTSLTATLASIGAAGIPGAGLVTLMMVLIAVNLPAELFILIVPVDWFLDRIRTMINVLGDSIGCAVVQNLCRAHLHKLNAPSDTENGNMEARSSEHSPNTQKSNVIYPVHSNGNTQVAIPLDVYPAGQYIPPEGVRFFQPTYQNHDAPTTIHLS